MYLKHLWIKSIPNKDHNFPVFRVVVIGKEQFMSQGRELDLWSIAYTGAEVQIPLKALILLQSPWIRDYPSIVHHLVFSDET